jgi:hypothetical protein
MTGSSQSAMPCKAQVANHAIVSSRTTCSRGHNMLGRERADTVEGQGGVEETPIGTSVMISLISHKRECTVYPHKLQVRKREQRGGDLHTRSAQYTTHWKGYLNRKPGKAWWLERESRRGLLNMCVRSLSLSPNSFNKPLHPDHTHTRHTSTSGTHWLGCKGEIAGISHLVL